MESWSINSFNHNSLTLLMVDQAFSNISAIVSWGLLYLWWIFSKKESSSMHTWTSICIRNNSSSRETCCNWRPTTFEFPFWVNWDCRRVSLVNEFKRNDLVNYMFYYVLLDYLCSNCLCVLATYRYMLDSLWLQFVILLVLKHFSYNLSIAVW